MANFPTHASTSAFVGFAFGTIGHLVYDVPLPSCVLAGGLCTVAGVLPDVDSDHAVILREVLAFVAAVIPMLLLDRFREMHWSQETIIVVSGLLYVIIRFGVGELIRRTTIHRGMWHSIPAAIATSLVIYFLCACPDVKLRIYKTLAVTTGFLWHLILDEIYAVERMGGRVRVKKSFGSALKFFGDRAFGNLVAYGALFGMVALLVMNPPSARFHDGHQHAQGADTHGHSQAPPNYQMTPVPSSPRSNPSTYYPQGQDPRYGQPAAEREHYIPPVGPPSPFPPRGY